MISKRRPPHYVVVTFYCAFLTLATAFSPLSSSFSRVTTPQQRPNVLPPQWMILPDPLLSSSLDALNINNNNDLVAAMDVQFWSHALSTSGQTVLAAAAAANSQLPDGWWGDYINIFKAVLSGVHETIDQPLRSIGIQQTWGVSIALFTFLARALLLPLSIQQSKSAEYMKILKPYMTEIKTKFKGNQDAQNRAVGKLYEDANQNPLSGCLLSLATIPIFLGVYRGIRFLALEGKLEEPFLFIPSLEGPVSPPSYSDMDWLLTRWTDVGGLPTPPLGWETTLAFLIMPVVLVLLQSATMKVLQPPEDENATEEEKKQLGGAQVILKFLPLLIGFFSLQVPAGLTIYWFSSNIFTLTQSLAVRTYFKANPPKIELPEYWDQLNQNKDYKEMTPQERRKAAEAGLSIGPTMDDLILESRFHVYVERQSFRETTPAWKRVNEMPSMEVAALPMDLQTWAKTEARVLRHAVVEDATVESKENVTVVK